MDFYFLTSISADPTSTTITTTKRNDKGSTTTSNVPCNKGGYLAMILVITAWMIGA